MGQRMDTPSANEREERMIMIKFLLKLFLAFSYIWYCCELKIGCHMDINYSGQRAGKERVFEEKNSGRRKKMNGKLLVKDSVLLDLEGPKTRSPGILSCSDKMYVREPHVPHHPHHIPIRSSHHITINATVVKLGCKFCPTGTLYLL